MRPLPAPVTNVPAAERKRPFQPAAGGGEDPVAGPCQLAACASGPAPPDGPPGRGDSEGGPRERVPSTTNAAYSPTVHNASSSHYTLSVMTWVALLFTPVVLAHQGWTYWVFRHRVGGTPVPSLLPPKPSSGPPASGPAAHAPSGL
jgi:hypothetical protein